MIIDSGVIETNVSNQGGTIVTTEYTVIGVPDDGVIIVRHDYSSYPMPAVGHYHGIAVYESEPVLETGNPIQWPVGRIIYRKTLDKPDYATMHELFTRLSEQIGKSVLMKDILDD